MFKAVRQTWNGLPPIAQGVIGTGLLVGAGLVTAKQVRNYNERQRLKKAQKVFDESNKLITVTDGGGNQVTVTINTAVTATKIHDAIYNNDTFGWTEDETAIVNALKVVPKVYIPDVENKYMTLYGKNLQQDVIAALDADEWDKVEHLFN